MLSTGLAKMLLPPVALVTEPRAPVRRSPRTMSTVKVSLTFDAAALGALIWPDCVSGIATSVPPILSVVPRSVLLKRNWKVMSSLPSPLLSTWIS
jgi:hypothetical protein